VLSIKLYTAFNKALLSYALIKFIRSNVKYKILNHAKLANRTEVSSYF